MNFSYLFSFSLFPSSFFLSVSSVFSSPRSKSWTRPANMEKGPTHPHFRTGWKNVDHDTRNGVDKEKPLLGPATLFHLPPLSNRVSAQAGLPLLTWEQDRSFDKKTPNPPSFFKASRTINLEYIPPDWKSDDGDVSAFFL